MTLFSTNTTTADLALLDVSTMANCDTMQADELAAFVNGHELDALASSIISSERAPYGARRAVAAKLNLLMPEMDWYNTVSTDTTEAAKAFEVHRKAIVKALKARDAKYNTAQAIKKIKEMGAQLAGAYVEPVKQDSTGGAGDRERPAHIRIAEEVLPLFKAYAIPSAAQEEKIENFYKANQSFEQEYTAEQIWACGVKFQEILQILNVPLEQHTADS